MNDKTAAQAEMLAYRLKKRKKHLRKWARRTGIDAFRLYDRDIPEIPLVLDLYGEAIAGALYRRPYKKDEAEEELWLEAMKEAAAHGTGITSENIVIKFRQRQRGKAQYCKIGTQGFTRIVSEEGLRFKVNLSDYLDTGLFLDRRAMRSMIRADSGGKRVLNLFCYTAAFSVHAAVGGAASTDSVDLSNTYLRWARDNFAQNGFTAKMLRLEEYFSGDGLWAGAAHRLIRADVGIFLLRAASARRRWDTIILDPPAFSNSTMARADFDLLRDCRDLLASCLALLAPAGKIWFSAAARSFKTTAAEIEASLAGRFPCVKVTDITGQTIDEDFRGKKTPKAFVISNK